MKRFLFIALIFGLMNCQTSNEETSFETQPEVENEIDIPTETSAPTITEEEETLPVVIVSIDTFTEFPPEIDGCSCYFSKNTEDFNQGEYIYMDDFGSEYGFLKIDGEMIRFNLEIDDWGEEKGTHRELSFENYILTLDYQEISRQEETFQQEGELILDTGSGEPITLSFYGECGC